MKQRITFEQIKELSDEQRQKLRDWWLMEEHYDIREKGIHDAFIDLKRYPLLSIGQMIEFLDQNFNLVIVKEQNGTYDIGHINTESPYVECADSFEDTHKSPELCDVLWKAVKSVL